MNHLAAIVPVHSHHDHAMDAGYVANRTSAVVLGSESTANIVRGADVPVGQYQILADGETRQFGDFTIKLVASRTHQSGWTEWRYFPASLTGPSDNRHAYLNIEPASHGQSLSATHKALRLCRAVPDTSKESCWENRQTS